MLAESNLWTKKLECIQPGDALSCRVHCGYTTKMVNPLWLAVNALAFVNLTMVNPYLHLLF